MTIVSSPAGTTHTPTIPLSGLHDVTPDLAYQRLAIVNVVFWGSRNAGDRRWVLIDAGLFGTADMIASAAAARFGANARPAAIVLTHGHFDHVGALQTLAERWDAPIYAHQLEHPFLDGSTPYPPPDPTVGGGFMAGMSKVYPRGPIDVRPHLQSLPHNGSVPHMPGWRWVATPGHTPGHVSLWREADRALIAGDAFVTTRQESLVAAALQLPELHGPPQYFTPDWNGARESVRRLAALQPALALTGHGRPMQGHQLQNGLARLARDFDQVALPRCGRYVVHQR